MNSFSRIFQYVESLRDEVRNYKAILDAERAQVGLDKFYPLPIVVETVDFFTKIINKKTKVRALTVSLSHYHILVLCS